MNGKQLRQLRRGKLDMTQQELADAIGVSVRFISHWENGESQEAIPKWLAIGVQGLAEIAKQPVPAR